MNVEQQYSSVDVGRAAIKMAVTADRKEEYELREEYLAKGIKTVAVDFGGEFVGSLVKIVERAVVASQRQGLVSTSHVGAGAVAGATHAALEQIVPKAVGFNVGGKIGVSRFGEHVCVAVYLGVGVLNLNEIGIGVAHRSLPLE